ncbi:hypothetical protein ACJX0J_034435, partial [Zea mays]
SIMLNYLQEHIIKATTRARANELEFYMAAIMMIKIRMIKKNLYVLDVIYYSNHQGGRDQQHHPREITYMCNLMDIKDHYIPDGVLEM